jgi:hypothetical protein
MKRIFGFLTAAAFAGMLFAANAFAASSGNFSATEDSTQCTINSGNGQLVGGIGGPSSVGGTVFEIGGNDISVQMSSGSGTTLIVTPSLVTGLFTDNKISSGTPTSIQDVGIMVNVSVTGPNADSVKIAPLTTGPGAGNTGGDCTVPANGVASCVIYDQRFVEVSSGVLASLSGCTAISASTVSGLNTCFELIESTLSAHAFNFYVQVPQTGTYTFDVDAQLFIGNHNTAGGGSIAGCAGPGTVTVQQVKNFSFDSTITF